MDIRSMCMSSPISDQSVPRKVSEFASHVQSLPSPPLMMDTVNEKKGSSLPPLTSILPPLHEINPTSLPPLSKSHHDTSPTTVVNHNLYHQSSTPKSPPSRVDYPQPPAQSMTQRSSLTSPSSSSSSSSSYPLQSSNDTTPTMWSRQPQPQPHPNTSYYNQSLPHPSSPQYPYAPQSQQRSARLVPHPSITTSMSPDYPPPYATSISYSSSGNNLSEDEDAFPYIQQTPEQSLIKMGKVSDHCNQISHFASQYRDMKMHYNQWNPQVNESHLTDMINRAYDVLNILTGLKGEITARRSVTSQSEIDLIRKQRTLGASTRTKYRKRSKRAAPPGRCHSCNISETPEWRRGPDGARTLCNACGLHFAKITRKRALSAMQQAEQQQQQQAAFNSTSLIPNSNGNVPNNSSNNNNNSSMPTPGASDVERDSPRSEQSRIVIDD